MKTPYIDFLDIIVPTTTRDEVFTPEGKKISKKRFLNKFLSPYKGYIDSKAFHEKIDANNLSLCEFIFSKRKVHQYSLEEFVHDPVLRHIILFVNSYSISYFFNDWLLINTEEMALEFSQERTMDEYSKFYKYMRRMHKPALQAAEEFLVQIAIEHQEALCKTIFQVLPRDVTPEEYSERDKPLGTPVSADVLPLESETEQRPELSPEPSPRKRNRSQRISSKETLVTLQRIESHLAQYQDDDPSTNGVIHAIQQEMASFREMKDRVFEHYLNRLT